MAESEQQEKMLSETIVKEAVGLGMKSPLRDSIVEAVDEAGGSQSGGGSGLPLAGALFGAGAALGFLAGRQSPELEDTSLEDIEEPEIIEDVIETESDEDESITETTDETESEGGSSRLIQLLITVGAIAAVAVLRRRLSGARKRSGSRSRSSNPRRATISEAVTTRKRRSRSRPRRSPRTRTRKKNKPADCSRR